MLDSPPLFFLRRCSDPSLRLIFCIVILSLILLSLHPLSDSATPSSLPFVNRYIALHFPVDPSVAIRQSLLAQQRDPISNATLGFQNIFAIALRDRTDRTVPLLEAAHITNISITLFDAIRDQDLLPSEHPESWDPALHTTGELGCLTSHIRVWERMIRENISTALIVESDADWDLRLRPILGSIGPAVDALIDYPFVPTNLKQIVDQGHSQALYTRHQRSKGIQPSVEPYGRGWDLLWLGSCGSNNVGENRIYSWNDTTVPPNSEVYTFAEGLRHEQYVEGTRSAFSLHGGSATCGYAYAITRDGADKMLGQFKRTNRNQDEAMSDACSKIFNLKCIAIWPQIFVAAAFSSNIDHTQFDHLGDDGKANMKDRAGDLLPEKQLDLSKGKNETNVPAQKNQSGSSLPEAHNNSIFNTITRNVSKVRRSYQTNTKPDPRVGIMKTPSLSTYTGIRSRTDADNSKDLPLGGRGIQFSARQAAFLHLHRQKNLSEFPPRWPTMFTKVDHIYPQQDLKGQSDSSEDWSIWRSSSRHPAAQTNRTFASWSMVDLNLTLAFADVHLKHSWLD